MEPTKEILENIQNLKNRLIVTYGIDEPLQLVNFDFQDRFRKAQLKFGMAMSTMHGLELQKMVSMMYRAYVSLEKQLEVEQVIPIENDCWRILHEESQEIIIICKQNDQLKPLRQKYQENVVVSLEELINLFPKEIMDFRKTLQTNGLVSYFKKLTL